MTNFNKKDLILGAVLGLLSALFLIFVIKNPYIEELKGLREMENFVWFTLILFPIIFSAGIYFAYVLSKFWPVVYQIARFVAVGVLNTIIDFGILNFLIRLTGITAGLAISPLNAIAFSCAAINSYFWNKYWTFGKKEKTNKTEFFQFFIISVIGITINTAIVALGTSFISPAFGLSPGAWVNLVKFIATFISMAWNFCGYKFVVFKA